MNKKIIAAGHICLDITPAFPQREIGRVDEIMKPGHLIQMGEADIHLGGSVSNTGLALKKLGARVSLMGKIGKDSFGELVMSQLNHYGAGEGMLVSADSATSYSVVVAPKGIDRIFLHHSGANDTFCSEDLDYHLIGEAGLFHFGYPPLMKKLYKNDGEDLLAIFKRVKELNVATSLDMAAVDEQSEAGRADWEGILEKVLPYVDFFVPSVEELAMMLDMELYRAWTDRAAGGDLCAVLAPEDVAPLAEKALALGAKAVLLKCGAPGMYLAVSDNAVLKAGDIDFTSWAGVRHFEPSYKPDKILSGTGAGDTSIAAFLYAVTLGKPWQDCLRLASATGACCVTAYDALSGLKPFTELEARIADGWAKNK